MRGLVFFSIVPLLASASPIFGVDSIHNEAAPILSSTESRPIPNSYIVIFKKDVSHASITDHHSWLQMQHVEVETTKKDLHKRSQTPMTMFDGLKHSFSIAGAIVGYSGHFDDAVIERVRRHPDVRNQIHNRLSSLTRDQTLSSPSVHFIVISLFGATYRIESITNSVFWAVGCLY